jgi:hypothetical protein
MEQAIQIVGSTVGSGVWFGVEWDFLRRVYWGHYRDHPRYKRKAIRSSCR